MAVTVIFIGDPHFQVTNILEVDIFIKKMVELATDMRPDLICIGGDLLHTHERLHTIPMNKAYEFVDKMRKIARTIVLVGNHDMISNKQFLTANHWMTAMKEWDNVAIADTVITEYVEDFSFIFAPYVEPGRFEEALNTNDGWEEADCIFAHQEFFGCKMGAIVSVEGDKWPLDYPDVVSGHIHGNQTPQPNVYYPGSSMQHAFGESSKNIIAVLTFEEQGSEYTLEEVDLELPRKKIVYMDVENIDDFTPPKTNDKIKITLSGSYDQFKALKKTKKYKSLIDTGIKIIFKAKKIDIDDDDIPLEVKGETAFASILSEIVHQENNKYLNRTYELVVNNK